MTCFLMGICLYDMIFFVLVSLALLLVGFDCAYHTPLHIPIIYILYTSDVPCYASTIIGWKNISKHFSSVKMAND
jgi:surfactin synthase thioesterase subunit